MNLTGEGPQLVDLIAGLEGLEYVPPSAHDFQAQLGGIVASAMEATSARAGILHIRERDTTRPVVSRGEGLERMPCVQQHAAARCDLPSYVATTNQGVCIPDAGQWRGLDPRPVVLCARLEADPFSESSLLAEPVTDLKGDVVGVLELADARDEMGGPAPFAPEVLPLIRALAAQAGSSITGVQLARKLREAQFETVFRLSVAAEFRDTDTAAHIQRVSRYSAVIADGLGLGEDEAELLRFASTMHDVGKLGVPDSILLKPGKLDDEEWHVMRSHTAMGAQILRGSDTEILQASEQVALSHHEKFDGSGYPLGLAGEEIPLYGRVVGLADAFDAITSKRCYKQAQPVEAGLLIAEQDSGSHFDPACVTALGQGFRDIVQVYIQYGEGQVTA